MRLACLLAFVAGFVALSHEILWYRVYAFTSRSAAEAFALLLGAYLLGIALGAYAARRLCADRALALRAVRWLLALSAAAFLVPPTVALVVARLDAWELSLPLVMAAAAVLGATFPLVSHASIAPDARAGSRISYVYVSNILGSAAGSLGTGFVLLEYLPLSAVGLLLACVSLAAAGLLAAVRADGRTRTAWFAACGAGMALSAALTPYAYGGLYERLQFKTGYQPGERFAQVIENRSGVITLGADGTVYGGGAYDGVINTSLARDANAIVRAYALFGLHPAPREVLLIGLSSGSWASVLADHPAVQRLTVVEINAGYVELVRRAPAVAGLLRHPKVHIEIDDARRWLVRNAERRFDLIVSNNTYHWRAHMSNLLSVEFTQLVRSRLQPGGLYYFNATGSLRAAASAGAVFPHVLGFHNCIAASDAPLVFDAQLWAEVMRRTTVAGRPALGTAQEERAVLERIDGLLRASARVRERGAPHTPITDDNMGDEWRAADR